VIVAKSQDSFGESALRVGRRNAVERGFLGSAEGQEAEDQQNNDSGSFHVLESISKGNLSRTESPGAPFLACLREMGIPFPSTPKADA
jgi:hypothetical protein